MPERPSRNTASDMRRRDRTSNQAARQGHAWTRGWREAQRYRQEGQCPRRLGPSNQGKRLKQQQGQGNWCL